MWHPDPDQLALAALPAEHRDAAVDEHLRGCTLCHGHVDSLRRTVDLAVSGGTEAFDEDDGAPDRIWTAITGELDIVDEGGVGQGRAEPGPRRWRYAVPVAAAVVGLVVGVGLGFGAGSGAGSGPAVPAPRPVAQLGPVGVAPPGASGTVSMVQRDGVAEMVVRVEGVDPPAGADYLEAWLTDASGGLVSLGALARSGDGAFEGVFSVPADLPLARFPTVDVSAERWDGDAGHSLESLLRGTAT